MPKVVEHDRRRAEIADAVLALIARGGTRAVTFRAVAEETGWSSGALSHYFASHNELMVGALRRAAELQGRIFRGIHKDSTLAAAERLRRMVESVLPLDDRRIAMTRIFLVFYAEATTDGDTRREVAEHLRQWRRGVTCAVRDAQAAGDLPAESDPVRLATELVSLADGLAMQAMLDPSVLPQVTTDDRVVIEFIESAWRVPLNGRDLRVNSPT